MGPVTSFATVPAELRPPWWLVLCAWLVGVGWFVLVVLAGKRDLPWLVALLAVAGSLGLWACTRTLYDDKTLLQAFDPRTQYWSFLWDGGIAIAIGISAYAVRGRLNPNGWHTRWWWALSAYAAGWIAGWVIRTRLDYHEYDLQRLWALVFDPAKVWHDWFTWPMLAGALIYYGVPLVFTKLWASSYAPYVPVVALVVWVLLGTFHDKHINLRNVATAFNFMTDRPVPDWHP